MGRRLEFSDLVRRHGKSRLCPVFLLQAVEPFVKELSHRFPSLVRPLIARFNNPGEGDAGGTIGRKAAESSLPRSRSKPLCSPWALREAYRLRTKRLGEVAQDCVPGPIREPGTIEDETRREWMERLPANRRDERVPLLVVHSMPLTTSSHLYRRLTNGVPSQPMRLRSPRNHRRQSSPHIAV